MHTIESSLYKIGWAALAAGIFLLVLLRLIPIPQPPCILRTLTGIYCPGCGGTRAVKELLHGHLIRSFYYHPFVPYAGLLYGWFMVSQTLERLFRGKISIGMRYHNWFLYVGIVIILVNWMIRNLWIPII